MSKFSSFLHSRQPIKAGFVIWLLVAIALSPSSYARAYLDAGTGSYILQVTVGVIFGATYTLKTYSAKIVQYFRNKHTKGKPEDK